MLALAAHRPAVRKTILPLRRDGVDLALHCWLPPEPRGAILYFHGLQSHAGWLWEVGPRYAARGVALFVLDRRGSGISPGPREEIGAAGTVLDDYCAAAAVVRRTVGDEVPLSLFGHCLGGSFLAALLHYDGFTVPHDSAIFCSAALGRMHTTLSERQRAALSEQDGGERWDADLRASDFTDVPRYREFIDSDELAVRRITQRSRATLLRLEELYLNPATHCAPVALAYASGQSDPVVDLAAARTVFQQIAQERGTTIQFPTGKHYLYYTDVCADLVAWSCSVVLAGVS